MLTYGLLLISGLFIGGLIIKHLSQQRFCVICASVSLTWLSFLTLYWTDSFDDPILLSLLIGQSIAGLYYFVEKRVPKVLRIFGLPFLLSLTAGFYMLIKTELVLTAFGLLLGLWLAAWLIFTYRNDPAKKTIAKILAKCCEDS
ncbi:MAG: hypothetical protein AAB541_03915 [Patescibacteria group bacterium]